MQKYEIINKYIFIFILIVVIIGTLITGNSTEIGSACLFKKITGLYCPFCGLTHSFNSIINLNFKEAFQYNALGPFLFLILVIITIKLIIELILNKKITIIFLNSKYTTIVIITALLIYGILRNIL